MSATVLTFPGGATSTAGFRLDDGPTSTSRLCARELHIADERGNCMWCEAEACSADVRAMRASGQPSARAQLEEVEGLLIAIAQRYPAPAERSSAHWSRKVESALFSVVSAINGLESAQRAGEVP